ncbi:MAG: T9SS type A sorting domain-containing protein, partial [Ginsengibacter sp.]
AIGQFGTDQYVAGGASAAAAGSAGNALTPMLVKNASGNYFMYHGDESDHGGLHRWSIDNLGSISAQTVNIAFPSSYIAPASGFIDLHAGLPFDGALPTSVGWSKSGAVSSYTSRKKYQNDGSPDVYSTFAQSSGTASVDRDLGTNNVSDSWKISGFLTFEGSDFTTGSKINSYVDVLDANSKVIARFFYQYTGGILSLRANNDVYLNNVSVRVTLNAMQPFEINVKNGVFTFSYAGNNPVATTIYDPAGNWQTPKTLRQYWTTGGTPAYGKNIGFMNMKFYKDFGTVPNIPPLANAGPDTTIILPKNNCMLKGVGVDNDGTIMSYSWTKTSGPAGGNIVNKSSATTALNALVKGVYEFSLKVVDNNGASAFDTIQISVDPPPNLPPIATAGNDQNLTLPTNITSLAGSGGDADGSITNYLWSKISGPSSYNIVNASSPVTDIAGMIQGIYLIQLEVTDNDGATAKDTIKITVNAALNIPPVVDAGKDTSIMSPSSTVFLNGSGSDIDGSIVNYLWKKISGPASFAIVNSSLAATDVTDLVAGVYTFQLKVTDNSGSATFDSLQVTVITLQNTPPAADAGTDTVLLLPKNKIDLTGAAIDPDGFIAGYSWTKIAGPSAMISSPSFLSTAVSGLVQGVYLFQLAVTDDQGAVGKDTITLNVMAAALPLKLLSFNAGLQNENVLLRWETSNEKNVSGFEIEKMTVNDWENLTFVNASSLNVFSNHYNSVDSFAKVGVTYYRLKIIDFDGKFVYSNIVSVDRKPTSNLIYQNYPNPFSNATTIKFEISEKTPVKIVIFNSGGIEVGVLVNEIKEPGSYEVNWNSRNIPPGSYFYNVITNENNLITKKMLKIR